MPDDIHVLESLPAYSLGSLDEAQARQVAEHLVGCLMCRTELSEFQAIVDQLGLIAPAASPSADVKSRLMGRIQSLTPKRVQSTRRLFPRRLIPAGAIAGVLLIIVLAVSNLLLWQRIDHPEFMSGPLGMRAIPLQNTDAAPEASGFVIIGANGRNGVLVVDELPTLEPEYEYQLWLVRDGQYTSGAVFPVDEDGYRGVRIQSPETLLSYSAIRITVEPAGGNTSPSGEQVLGGSLFNP